MLKGVNSEDNVLCRKHKAGDHLMVMKKPGLENDSGHLDLSLTTSSLITGGKKNKHKKTKRKIKRKHNHSKRRALTKSF